MGKVTINPRRKGGIAVSLCSPGPALGSLRAGLVRTSCIRSASPIYFPPRLLWSLFIRPEREENHFFFSSRQRGETCLPVLFIILLACWHEGPGTRAVHVALAWTRRGSAAGSAGAAAPPPPPETRERSVLEPCKLRFPAPSRKPREQLRLVNNRDNLPVSYQGWGFFYFPEVPMP